MENAIRNHIDKIKKQKLKITKNDLKDDVNEKEIRKKIETEYEYQRWLKNTLSIQSNSYIPVLKKELDLFRFLSLEILYKQNFKLVCDRDHPIVIELLKDLGLSDSEIGLCIDKVKCFKAEKLDYLNLFEDEIIKEHNIHDEIIQRIDKIASDAPQGQIVSHPVKMIHPDSKYPKIDVKAKRANDGFVRSGNVKVEFDMHINAAKLKVFKFLALKYKENTLLDYIEREDHTVFMKIFGVSENKAKQWMNSFLSCLEKQIPQTGTHIRQVFFPVENSYHLLSILKPSGLVFRLKESIDYLNDRSPDSYIGKKFKKEDKYFEKGFYALPDITVTKHGGDHPKNISGLNNKFQTYYLLSSKPPTLEKRSIRFPKSNFFGESIRVFECREIFSALHKLFVTDYNNHKIREGRDYRIKELLDQIIRKMWMVRSLAQEDPGKEKSSLKNHQMIWLNNDLEEKRENEDQWLDKLLKEIANWMINSYEKSIGKQAFKLGKELRQHILNIVTDNREALR